MFSFLNTEQMHVIATTQPTTQNRPKQLWRGGLIIEKRIASAAKLIASAAKRITSADNFTAFAAHTGGSKNIKNNLKHCDIK
jgi:hypothetical protein